MSLLFAHARVEKDEHSIPDDLSRISESGGSEGSSTEPRITNGEGKHSQDTSLARAVGVGAPRPFDPAVDGYGVGQRRLLLVGPPGTGKTTALLNHMALPALRTSGVSSRVLTCSFTRSAAKEIRDRMASALGGRPDDYRPSARTVHSEAFHLVRAVRGAVRLVDQRRDGQEPDLAGLAVQADDGRLDLQSAALRVWSLARNRGERDLRHALALARPGPFSLTEITAAIKGYEKSKRTNNEIDFVDLLTIARTLPAPTRDLLVIDEAQDCSALHWSLIEHWAAASRWVAVVGDPDQAIHRWCGARPERLAELAQSFELRYLDQSYRVPRRQHAIAVALIRHNRGRFDAPYVAAGRDGNVRCVTRQEVVGVLEQAAAQGTKALVLARSCSIVARHARALAGDRVPFMNERGYSPIRGDLRHRNAVRALVELRAGRPVEADRARVLLDLLPANACFPPRRKKGICTMLVPATDRWVTIDDLIARGVQVEPFMNGSLAEALRVPKLGRDGAGRARLADDLAGAVERFGVQILDAQPSVKLTTFHGAKGQEAALVVVDLEAPRRVFDTIGADPGALEAERQLLYVALTRSSDQLVLVPGGRRDLGRELGLRLP